MARQEQQQPLKAQFMLGGSNAGALVVSSKRQMSLLSSSSSSSFGARSAAPLAAASSARFTTRATQGASTKRMLAIRPARGAAAAAAAASTSAGARALPLATLSVASLSLGKPKAKEEPKKKKKSAKDIWDTAVKSALRGGLPGMGAMAIQVRGRERRRLGWPERYATGGADHLVLSRLLRRQGGGLGSEPCAARLRSSALLGRRGQCVCVKHSTRAPIHLSMRYATSSPLSQPPPQP